MTTDSIREKYNDEFEKYHKYIISINNDINYYFDFFTMIKYNIETNMFYIFLNSIDECNVYIIDELIIIFIDKILYENIYKDNTNFLNYILYLFNYYYFKYKKSKINGRKYILYILDFLINYDKKNDSTIIDKFILKEDIYYKIIILNDKYGHIINSKNIITNRFKYNEDCDYYLKILLTFKIIKYLKYLNYNSDYFINRIVKIFENYYNNNNFILKISNDKIEQYSNLCKKNNVSEYSVYYYSLDEDKESTKKRYQKHIDDDILRNKIYEIINYYEIKNEDIYFNNKIIKMYYLFNARLVWISSVIRTQEMKKILN